MKKASMEEMESEVLPGKDRKAERGASGKQTDAPRVENKMGVMPIPKLVLTMSGPAMFSMMIRALYNVVDSIFVAKTGEDAMAALTLVFPAQMMLVAVGVGTGIGINSLVSRRLGAHRYDEANEAAGISLKLAFLSWLVFALCGLFLSGPFVRLFSEKSSIIEGGIQYLTIVLVFSLPALMDMLFEKILQAEGNMVLPMIGSLTGCFLNIALDPIFIFGLFGVPAMGIVGAAVATIIGQVAGMSITLYGVCKRTKYLKIDFRSKMRARTVKEVYAVGFPSILLQTVVSVANFLMNYILVGFSTTAVAVMGTYGRLQSFIFMPVFGLNQGTTPIFGYNFGARNRGRIVKTLKVGWTMSLTVMTIGLLLFTLAPEKLLGLFDATKEMLQIGIPAFRIISICFLPAAIGVVSGGLFAATGHGVISLLSAVIRQLVLIVPGAYIFGKIGGLSMVWWAFPLSEIFGLTFILLMLHRVFKKDINPMGN